MKLFSRVIILLLIAIQANGQAVTVTANFNYVIKYGCKADTVIFTNTSANAVTYSWVFGDNTYDTATNPRHVYLLQGIDTVKLYAANDTLLDSSIQYISHIHPLHAAFTVDTNIICQGGSITLSDASIDTLPTYQWNFGDGSTDVVPNTKHTYAQSGVYTVALTVTDFIPCSDTAYKVIYVDTISKATISVSDTVICKATYITFTGSYASVGDTGVVWDFADGDVVKNVNPISYGYNLPGVYVATMTAVYRACPNVSTTKKITVVAQPSINIGNDTSICAGGEAILLKDAVNAGAPGASWIWSTGETGDQIQVVRPGIYTATVRLNGCYATQTVKVSNDCYMNIPNAFTPNNDGFNDYFYPRQYLTSGLISFKMDIYNRWGEVMFTTTSVEGSGWDGKFNNVAQPQGVYVYVIDATFKDGQHEHHQGNFTLLR